MQSETPTLGNQSLPPTTPPQNADVIPGVGTRYPRFTLIVSIGLAALFGELMLFLSLYYNPNQGAGLPIALGIGTFALSFVTIFASLTLPHMYFRPRYNNYSPIIFLMREWAAASAIVIIGSLLELAVGIFVVKGDLGAIGEIIRSLALYTLTACIFLHGAILFVRYVQFLYEREMHQSYKIVTIAGVTAVALLILILYLLPYDLGRIGSSGDNSGLLSLHLSIRDVWLISCSIYVFMWHLSVIADH